MNIIYEKKIKKNILFTFSINVLSSVKQKLSSIFDNCSISFTVKRLILVELFNLNKISETTINLFHPTF
jgi:hypothetical protein